MTITTILAYAMALFIAAAIPGPGMTAIVAPNDVGAVGKQLRARPIGRIEPGSGVVRLFD